MSLIELVHLVLTAFMTGLIWLVQLVHYPTFHYVQHDRFQSFENFHSTSISYIVMPAMLAELGTAGWLLWIYGGAWLWLLNFMALVVIWGSTFLLSVPCHNQLMHGYDHAVVDRLLRTNWPRTILWTVRTTMLLAVFGVSGSF